MESCQDETAVIVTKKEKFFSDYAMAQAEHGFISKMVIALKLPTGATELIVNSEKIDSKIEYYNLAYTDKLELASNNDIKIVGWLFA